jgi:hypothetical protein
MEGNMNFKTPIHCLKGIFTIAFLFTSTFLLSENTSQEKEKIISVVKQFFDVLESRDVNHAKKILIPEGFSFSLRKDGKEDSISSSSLQQMINTLPDIKDKYKEIMSNPKIFINDSIAILWADYKFFINDKLSHGGVDAFSLIKIDNHWKIAGIIYTVESQNKKDKIPSSH